MKYYLGGISFIGIPPAASLPSACPISGKITCGARPPDEVVSVVDESSLGAEFKLVELGVGGDIAPAALLETGGGGG